MRAACVDKNGMKKGSWSEEEDSKLRDYIFRYGHWNWRLLPKFAGLARCGKSCRLQWMNYLKPGVKRGNYSKEEEHLITKLHHELGNKWSAIARKLPGRTDNEIKNYWHTHLKKRTQGVNVCYNSSELGFNNVPSPVNWDSEDTAASSSTSRSGMCEKVGVVAETSNSGFEFLQNERERSLGSFWTQQFLVDTDSYIQPYETTFPVLSDEIGFFSGYE
ncbi:hypothetical protein ACS0TY_023406 [Phlomoides rotata]